MELTRRGLLPLGFAAAAIRPASGQEGMVALQGAAVFDGERRLGPATILIAGESIRAVGPGAAVPAGARRIDLTGRTVIPGLVSAHSHVGNSEGADTGGRFGTRDRRRGLSHALLHLLLSPLTGNPGLLQPCPQGVSLDPGCTQRCNLLRVRRQAVATPGQRRQYLTRIGTALLRHPA